MQPPLKKIKRDIYGKPQTIKVFFPAGLGEIALDEIQSILQSLWLEQKFKSTITLSKTEIQITDIHMSAITELLMRSQCITDIRLVIFEGKANGRKAFAKKCDALHWDYFISQHMSLKIKVKCNANKSFNSTILKKIMKETLSKHALKIVTGENAQETTCVYVDFYEEKLIISISLAGEPLYKRNYRGTLSASAPLREDAASSCIRKALKFAKLQNNLFLAKIILVPFSGTGTFIFEYLQWYFHCSPVLFGRTYALEKMPLFRSETFNFLLKQAKQHCHFFINKNTNKIKFICIDHSDSANTALTENMAIFKTALAKIQETTSTEFLTPYAENFLKFNVEKLMDNTNQPIGDIFIPLNPPYGIRFSKNTDSSAFYKKIALKINEISQITRKSKNNLLGFILCPDEATWSSFCRNLMSANVETYHFMQGGIDIRVCQFFIPQGVKLRPYHYPQIYL